MPRSSPHAFLTNLKQQATKALTALQGEITRREKELGSLRAEAARWEKALGEQTAVPRAPVAQRKGRAASTNRLDWNAILTALPPSFTAKEVAEKSGKPMEQVYAGVSRWTKDKKVKKGKDGYQKILPGSSVPQKGAATKRKSA